MVALSDWPLLPVLAFALSALAVSLSSRRWDKNPAMPCLPSPAPLPALSLESSLILDDRLMVPCCQYPGMCSHKCLRRLDKNNRFLIALEQARG